MEALNSVNTFWNQNLCGTARTVLTPGTPTFFEEVERKRSILEPFIPAWAEYSKWQGKKVLEIGCGLGIDAIEFAKYADVTAVDYSIASLKLATQHAQQKGRVINFIHANAEKLSDSLPVQTFDFIYSFGVLHHTLNPENAYREITKYMDKQSVFKLMVYHTRSLKTLGVILRHGIRNWRQKLAYYSENVDGSPVTYTYTKNEITELLQKCGLSVIAIEVKYLWMRWYLKWMPTALLRWMEAMFGWNLCVTAVLK